MLMSQHAYASTMHGACVTSSDSAFDFCVCIHPMRVLELLRRRPMQCNAMQYNAILYDTIQNKTKCACPHTQESVLRVHEHSAGTYKEYKGLAEIGEFFKGYFLMVANCKNNARLVNAFTEIPRQVNFVWDCPNLGVVSAVDHALFRSGDFKIMVQVRCWCSAGNVWRWPDNNFGTVVGWLLGNVELVFVFVC